MSVEASLESDFVATVPVMDDGFSLQDEPLNGTDARRRLEDKIEELRLKKELQDFDFDF